VGERQVRRLVDPFEASQIEAIGAAHHAELTEKSARILEVLIQHWGKPPRDPKAIRAIWRDTNYHDEVSCELWRVIQSAPTVSVRLALIGKYWHSLGHLVGDMLQAVPAIFASMPMETARRIFNTDAQLCAWEKLPDKVQVFRGGLTGPVAAGLSWAAEFGLALRFATWRGRQIREVGKDPEPLVLVGRVRKTDVYGVDVVGLDDREIIAAPASVEITDRLPLADLFAGRLNAKVVRYFTGIDLSGGPASLVQAMGKLCEIKADTERRLKDQEAMMTPDPALPRREPRVNPHPKVGRNDPCPCGSGKKFKKCCGAQMAARPGFLAGASSLSASVIDAN
jgi:hypothetical protein